MFPPTMQKLLIALLAFSGFWLLSRYLLPIALPFLLAALLVIAAEPLVRMLHIKLGLPRNVASGLGIVIALLLTVLLVLCLCALLVRQLSSLTGVLPDLESTAISSMESLEGFLISLACKAPPQVSPLLRNGVEGFFSDGTQLLNQVFTRVLSFASGILTRLPDGALGFGTWILASFMLSAKLPSLRQFYKTRMPLTWKSRYLPAVSRLKRNLSGWLLAQLKLTGVTFLVLLVGFLILRIPHAPFWAALISLVDALPVLGTGTVLLPWSLVCFLQGDHFTAIGLLSVYTIAVLLRSVLEPRLIGKQLGLDPLVTLFALYAGYRLWGILGMLLSPLIAVTVTQLVLIPKESS